MNDGDSDPNGQLRHSPGLPCKRAQLRISSSVGNRGQGQEDFLEGVAPTHLRAQAHSPAPLAEAWSPLQSQWRGGGALDFNQDRGAKQGGFQEADITAESSPTPGTCWVDPE